jgi:hypothetical protein
MVFSVSELTVGGPERRARICWIVALIADSLTVARATALGITEAAAEATWEPIISGVRDMDIIGI